MSTNLLTQERLHKVLEYSSETGIFTWKVRMSNKVKTGDIAGSCYNKNYVGIQIDRKSYLAHRLAFLYMCGYLPEYEVDHLDGAKNNNQWSNLRHVSKICNLQNRKLSTTSTSGFIGVSWHKNHKKWSAYITIHGKQIYLGRYKTIEEAALARCHFEDECPNWVCNHLAINRIKLRSMGYEI